MSLSSAAAQEKSTKDTNEYILASCTGNRHRLLDIKPIFGSSSTQLTSFWLNGTQLAERSNTLFSR